MVRLWARLVEKDVGDVAPIHGRPTFRRPDEWLRHPQLHPATKLGASVQEDNDDCYLWKGL